MANSQEFDQQTSKSKKELQAAHRIAWVFGIIVLFGTMALSSWIGDQRNSNNWGAVGLEFGFWGFVIWIPVMALTYSKAKNDSEVIRNMFIITGLIILSGVLFTFLF